MSVFKASVEKTTRIREELSSVELLSKEAAATVAGTEQDSTLKSLPETGKEPLARTPSRRGVTRRKDFSLTSIVNSPVSLCQRPLTGSLALPESRRPLERMRETSWTSFLPSRGSAAP